MYSTLAMSEVRSIFSALAMRRLLHLLLALLVQHQLMIRRVAGSWQSSRESGDDTAKGDGVLVTGTFCQWEKMNATCRSNEVIVMATARYGRMQPGRCVSRSYGSVGCSVDVLAHMDSVCSGRQSCGFVVPDERLRELRPCPIDFAAYLEASYRCVAVIRPAGDNTGRESSSCGDADGKHPRRSIEVLLGDESTSSVPTGATAAVRANADADTDAATTVVDPVGLSGTVVSGGYIASLVTDRTGAGSAGCPWRLRAAPWQRINITLIDFSAGLTAAAVNTMTIDASGNTDTASMLPPEYRHVGGHVTNEWSDSSSSTSDVVSYDVDESPLEEAAADVGQQSPAAEYDGNVDLERVPSPHRRGHAHRGHSGDVSVTRDNVGRKMAMSGLDGRRRGGHLQSTLSGTDSRPTDGGDDDKFDHVTNGRQHGRVPKNGVDEILPAQRAPPAKSICQKYAVVRERMPQFQHHHGNDAVDAATGAGNHHHHHHRRNHGDGAIVNRDTVVCGDTEREKVVYLSATNEVELELVQPLVLLGGGSGVGDGAARQGGVDIDGGTTSSSPSNNGIFFLLHYETVGCRTLPAPTNGWHARTGSDVMVVGCNATKERWYLHCDGRRWIGEWRNCTAHASITVTDMEEISVADWSSPFGILVVSACGVAVGLFVGILLLSIMLFFVRRRKRRTFRGIDPIFISVPNSSTGGATLADGSMTSSAYHYGTCIVHHDGVDATAAGRHGSLPAAVFCMGSSPYPVRHHHHHQQQQQRTATMSSSSAVAYGIVPCSILSATSGDDGDVVDDDEDDRLEPVDFDDGTSTAFERRATFQDDIRFCATGGDRYYGKMTTASNFRNSQQHQSRWILPPTPDLMAAVPPPSPYGTTSMSAGYRGAVPCHSCSGCGQRESLPPPPASSTSACYGLLRLQQQRAATAATTDDAGPDFGSQPEVRMSDRYRHNSSTMTSNRCDEGLLGDGQWIQ